MAGTKRTDNRGRILKDGESQRPDGMYRYRYTDATGKRRDVYSSRLVATDRTPKGCKEDLSLREKKKLINRDLDDGIKAQVENKATLNDMFILYMSGKTKLKESTRSNYIYMYEKYVQDILGIKQIKSIKYSTVFSFYCNLIDNLGFKPNSMEIIHTILHPVFKLAVRDNYIRTNPTQDVMAEIKKTYDWEKPKRIALTIPEQEAFISFISASPIYRRWLPLMTVFLGTGCRVGEVIGLRWEDCDFENRTISINHNMLYRHYKGEQEMRFHITTPKTAAGIRVIPMLSEVKDALLNEYNLQKEFGFCDEVVDGYSGFIFQNRFGGLLSPHDINRAIERIYTAYNKEETANAAEEHRTPLLIRHFSVHNLRHTFCTRFCENESNLKVIQEIMGHADIETTMNIYAEATTQKKQESFARLEGKIKIS
ncbi:MAG: site-specific integrase [Oscillospiraceae bacterium]|nr:site-specific integrase [Oscillospiraceae bacterium]